MLSKIHIDASKLTICQKAKSLNVIDIKQSEKTFHDIIQKWLKYFQSCGFQEGDNRHHNLSMILQMLMWVNSQGVYHINEINSDGQSIKKNLKGLGEENTCKFLDQFNLINMLSFVTMLNFQLEIIFKELLIALKINPKENEYYWIVRSLIEEIFSDEDEDEKKKKRRILNILAQIRNSLHNNGVYNSKYPFDVEIDGKEYNFTNGVRIDCANWTDISKITKATLETVIKILSSKKCTDIPYIAKK